MSVSRSRTYDRVMSVKLVIGETVVNDRYMCIRIISHVGWSTMAAASCIDSLLIQALFRFCHSLLILSSADSVRMVCMESRRG